MKDFRINLPKTILDRASLLFKKVNDGGRLRGRPNEAVTAACLYISCRLTIPWGVWSFYQLTSQAGGGAENVQGDCGSLYSEQKRYWPLFQNNSQVARRHQSWASWQWRFHVQVVNRFFSLICVPKSCLSIHISFRSFKILWTLGALKGDSKGSNMYCKEGFTCFFLNMNS